jgi:hypothetical protein
MMPTFFAYADNYLIDLKAAIILDVEPTRAIRQAEVGAVKTMIDRTEACFGLKPQRLCGDTAYGAAEILGWMVEEKSIEPHVSLWEKGERTDGTFSRSDFAFDPASCFRYVQMPGRQSPSTIPQAIQESADRRHQRQYEDLPGEPARLRRMRAQGELLPWSTSTQNPQKHP